MNIGRFHMNGRKTYTPKNMSMEEFYKDHPLPESQREAIHKILEESNNDKSTFKFSKRSVSQCPGE